MSRNTSAGNGRQKDRPRKQPGPARGPDPFVDRIGSGYERILREQWTELEALLQADLTRARSSKGPGSGGLESGEEPTPDAADQAEEYLRKTAMLMTFVFDRLENVDLTLRGAAAKIVAGEGTRTCLPYGQRVLRDHWAQLRGRLRADIEELRFSCNYGRMGLVSDDFRKGQEVIAEDAKAQLRDAEILMEHFVFAEAESMDECLENAGADFLAGSRRATRRAAQEKGRSRHAPATTTKSQ